MKYRNSCIILWVSFLYVVSSVRIPHNPCPDIFSYYRDNDGQIYGEATVPYDRATSLTFSVNASLAARFGKNDKLLRLKLNTSQKQLNGNVRTLTYHIAFLKQNVIPKITQIEYNGNVLCQGPPEPLIPGTEGITNTWYSTNFQFTRLPEGYLYEDHQDPGISDAEIPVKSPDTITGSGYNTRSRTTPSTTPSTTESNWISHTSTTQKSVDNFQCGVRKSSKITPLLWGAADTEVGQFPWLVAVMAKNEDTRVYEYRCSATLISNKHVITAGRCVFNYVPLIEDKNMLLVMGTNDIKNWKSNDAVTREVTKVVTHPDFKNNPETAHVDISVITMMRPVRFSDLVIPACLWKGNTDLSLITNRKGTVVGYGQDESAKKNGAEHVLLAKYADLTIVSQDDVRCRSDVTASDTFCAGEAGKTSTCTGDIGSGLVLYRNGAYQLRGVVSYDTCDNNREYSVFCDVAKFSDWVESCIKPMKR